mgnify:CR=1 FL=1
MKILLSSIALLGAAVAARAQIPVTDVANLVNNQLAHIENIAKWIDSIAQLKTQIDQLRRQIEIQGDIRRWSGDPAAATARIALDQLGAGNLVREYGRARAVIISTAESLASLGGTLQGTYRAIDSVDLEGGALVRDAQAYRRYAVLDAQQENFQSVVTATKERERALQADLAQTLADLKDADTDAEVRKQSAKIEAVNGQLAALAAERRDQADQVAAQKIANDARLEQEHLAAAELEAKNDFLANQRVTAFMRTLKVRQSAP